MMLATTAVAVQLLPLPAQSADGSILYAVGDIADCSAANPSLTSASSLDPEELAEHGLTGSETLSVDSLQTEELLEDRNGIILALGDLAYPVGSAEDFMDCYDKVWGTLTPRTYPVPGNHEYKSDDALPYKQYFLERRGLTKTFYSFDYSDWHLIALDSEIDASPESEQMAWLTQDLADVESKCVIAFFHKPAISSVPRSHSENAQKLYQAVSAAGASLVLNGHNHFYERSAILSQRDVSTSQLGTRSFTVGTGGGLRGIDPIEPGPNSEKIIAGTSGVLELLLQEHAYQWKFISIKGDELDSGIASCSPMTKVKY